MPLQTSDLFLLIALNTREKFLQNQAVAVFFPIIEQFTTEPVKPQKSLFNFCQVSQRVNFIALTEDVVEVCDPCDFSRLEISQLCISEMYRRKQGTV